MLGSLAALVARREKRRDNCPCRFYGTREMFLMSLHHRLDELNDRPFWHKSNSFHALGNICNQYIFTYELDELLIALFGISRIHLTFEIRQ